jgi:hypothetical protein
MAWREEPQTNDVEWYMKSRQSEMEQRYLLLFKLDAKNLFDRIYSRRHEYVEVFSLKRNRAVFRDVFQCRYHSATVYDLSHCPVEVIETLNQFYTEADEIYWYLKHTEDMPNTIEDEITRKVAALKKHYDMLALYVDAVLSGEAGEESAQIESFNELPHHNADYDRFTLEGEVQEDLVEEEFLQPEQYPDPDEADDGDENPVDA